MRPSPEDTIYGIATPVGEGGIGILRISGRQATEVARSLVHLRSGLPLEHVKSQRLYLGDLRFPEASVSNGGTEERGMLLDEAMIVVMRAPRSYTGEDVVEIQTHGGPFILTKVCQALGAAGARIAEPGEFTKRAFLNGRLDLSQAEAILDTIQARTASSLKAAQMQLRGGLAREVNALRDELIRLLAHLEAGMDFVEEDISFIHDKELLDGLNGVRAAIGRLRDTFREGRIVREGMRIGIIGRPNVGKSSLLNALVQYDRAIVSAVPGTTRDVIHENANIRGIPVNLIDTAGLRDTQDPIEGEGIRRTREVIDQADVLLAVIDGSVPLIAEDLEFVQTLAKNDTIFVVNKSDLVPRVHDEEIQQLLGHGDRDQAVLGTGFPLVVRLSAKTGHGIEALRDAIRDRVVRPGFEPESSVVITHLRHHQALNTAHMAVERAIASVQGRVAGECIALDIRESLDALGEITGAVTHEDILDRIFRDFCIGK